MWNRVKFNEKHHRTANEPTKKALILNSNLCRIFVELPKPVAREENGARPCVNGWHAGDWLHRIGAARKPERIDSPKPKNEEKYNLLFKFTKETREVRQ